GRTPSMLVRPYVGLSPTMPHWLAGSRTEPAVSVPRAAAHSPAATATPEPPLEPPGTCSGFQGLRTAPNSTLVHVPPYANSCRLVLPRRTAPACRSRVTTGASRSGIQSASTREPPVVRKP